MDGAGLTPEVWETFALAEVGAAAALAGLLVVAASINIARIIEVPSIVARLGGTLVSFAMVLVTASLVLVPSQSRVAVGVEIAVVGAVATWIVVSLHGLRNLERQYRGNAIRMVGLNALASVLVVLSGVFLATGVAGGLYWFVPGSLLAFTVGIGNAWVALVEILR